MNECMDCFTAGSSIRCKMLENQVIEGEVLAFDFHSKILILKSDPSDDCIHRSDVNFINLLYVKDIEVFPEKENDSKSVPTALDIQKINNVYKKQSDNRSRLLTAAKHEVHLDGKNLYYAISGLLRNETKWKGDQISVYDEDILISPPYNVDCIKGKVDSDHFNYVKRIVCNSYLKRLFFLKKID